MSVRGFFQFCCLRLAGLLALVALVTLAMGCRLDDNRLRGSLKQRPGENPPPEAPPPPGPEAPSGLSYLVDLHYYSQDEILLEPEVSGGVESFVVEPPLPLGLSLDAATGVISGVLPPLLRATYSVTAHGPGGSTSYEVELEAHFKALVNDERDIGALDTSSGICAAAAPAEEGVCTLRAALEQANALNPLPALIEVPAGDYELTTGEQLLVGTQAELLGAGPGSDPNLNTIIRQTTGTTQRVIEVNAGAVDRPVLLKGVTIRDGDTSSESVAPGGGVYGSLGFLRLEDCEVLNNTGSFFGGGVTIGSGIIRNCLIDSNEVLGFMGSGGGIGKWGEGDLLVQDSVISRNKALDQRGGGLYIWSGGGVELEGVHIFQNEAGENFTGAGISVFGVSGPIVIRDSHIEANSTPDISAALTNGIAIDVRSGTGDIRIESTQITGHVGGRTIYIGGHRGYFSMNTSLVQLNTGRIYFEYSNHQVIENSTLISAPGVAAISLFQVSSSGHPGVLQVTNSTFSGGRGIRAMGSHSGETNVRLNHVTFDNTGELSLEVRDGAKAEVVNTVFANTVASCSVSGTGSTLTSLGGNLERAAGNSCQLNHGTDQPGTDPLVVGPLDYIDSEALTPTLGLSLDPLSPAVDAAVMDYCPDTDQNGRPRPLGGGCDSGAVEVQ